MNTVTTKAAVEFITSRMVAEFPGDAHQLAIHRAASHPVTSSTVEEAVEEVSATLTTPDRFQKHLIMLVITLRQNS